MKEQRVEFELRREQVSYVRLETIKQGIVTQPTDKHPAMFGTRALLVRYRITQARCVRERADYLPNLHRE